jgi:hypothetical protein
MLFAGEESATILDRAVETTSSEPATDPINMSLPKITGPNDTIALTTGAVSDGASEMETTPFLFSLNHRFIISPSIWIPTGHSRGHICGEVEFERRTR